MIKRTLLFFILIFLYSICFAGDPNSGYGTHIAVEFKVDNKSYKPPIIGHLEYTGFSIDIVAINEGAFGVGIQTQAWGYTITKKTISTKGVHHITAKNQYGIIASGTIDFRDQVNPKITLIIQNGVVITNISNEGKEWQKKHIPNIELGQ